MITKKVSISQLAFEEADSAANERISYVETVTIYEDGVLLGTIRPARKEMVSESRESVYAEVSLGEWDALVAYVLNDVISYNGVYYKALQASTNIAPETTAGYWEALPVRTQEEEYIETVKKAISVYTQSKVEAKTEQEAQAFTTLYPDWEPWIRAKENVVYKYSGKFYRAITTHVTQPTWTPDVAFALWHQVHVGDTVPTWSQPLGAHDAYPAGFTVTHNLKTWTSNIDANVWEPGVGTQWTEVVAEPPAPETPQPWVQPTGAQDAYPLGATVTHSGSTWTSDVADNVWEPGVYGWTVV